ncbi:restriction endonuclease subunit S [Listeria booriae]|uniref:restriction endonuclease subunit S n=1 Tax=Listeria booriae TaxID=1552123 RepID=UPI00162AD05E|nr:restriction endonuclease subunit S [Listeria booriae]MBC1574327.1 restriction endonuclease subunit S [Listeria booriae]
MSDKKRNVPVLRFNGFSDAWEQRKLGELGKVTTGKAFSSIDFDEQGEYLVITNKDISTSSRSQNVVTDRINVSDKNIIEKYNLNGKNILVTMDGVNLGKTAMYSNENALLAQRVGRIQSTQLEFVYQITSSNNFFMTMRTLSVGNAIKHISLSQISNYSTLVPNNEAEQQKIGELFKHLDNTIALHQRKLDALKQMKKGFLQQLFPENGEKVPRVRFADFQEEWEQRKLGDITDSFGYGLNASAKEYDGKSKYIRITDIDESSHLFNQENLTSPDTCLDYANNYLLEEGDILFARTGASTGKSYYYTKNDGRVYFAGFLIRARIKQKYDVKFIFQNTLTSKYNNFIQITSQRSGQPGINALEYSKFALCIPKLSEQNKIGSFFQQLDKTIALYHYRLDQLNILKKSCLQNMFI